MAGPRRPYLVIGRIGMDPAAINAVASRLYGAHELAPIAVEDLYRLAEEIDRQAVDEILYSFAEQKLIQLSLDHRTILPKATREGHI